MALFPFTQYDFPNVSNYDSDLREVLRLLKNLLNDYNKIIEAFEEQSAEFDEIKKQFEELEKLVNEFENLIDEKVDEAIDEYKTEIEQQLNAINARIDLLINRIEGFELLIDVKLAPVVGRFNVELRHINERIDELQFELPEVFNIVKGEDTDAVTFMYDIYDATRDHAYTALEFDSRNLTAAELDGMNRTALDWDVNGGHLLYPLGYCRNPFTGEPATICSIVERLAQIATGDGDLTAAEYDALELTAEDFEAYNISAFDYDFNSRNILTA